MNSTYTAVKTRSSSMPAGMSRNIEILNAELNGEYFGIAAYEAALGTGLLEDAVRDVAKSFQASHVDHAKRLRETIIESGGEPVKAQSWEKYASDSPPPPLNTQADVLNYAASLEQGAASATVAAVGEVTAPEIARLIASIGGVEAMHWAVLLGALGQNPAPVSFIALPGE